MCFICDSCHRYSKVPRELCLYEQTQIVANAAQRVDTVGRLFSRTAIFMDFANFLFYTKIVLPKYNIYAGINHNHISGSP